MALDALEALALMLSSTLGLISLALAVVFSSEQDWQAQEFILVGQAVALDALVTLALMLSSTLGFITLALTLVLSSAQTRQVPELMLLGQAVALKPPFSIQSGRLVHRDRVRHEFDVLVTDLFDVDQAGLFTEAQLNA